MGGVSKARAFRDFIKEKFKHYEIYFNEEKPVMGAVRKAIKGEKNVKDGNAKSKNDTH